MHALEYIQLPASLANATNLDQVSDFDLLRFVLIVEKETVFMHLLQMPWYTNLEQAGLSQHILIVTAKG